MGAAGRLSLRQGFLHVRPCVLRDMLPFSARRTVKTVSNSLNK